MVGQPLAVAEVGVQSGGSILMWQAVLGAQIKFYGLDINPGCNKFKDAATSITIGDQADPKMWNSFFSTVTNTLDILVDDAGHTPDGVPTPESWRLHRDRGHSWSPLHSIVLSPSCPSYLGMASCRPGCVCPCVSIPSGRAQSRGHKASIGTSTYRIKNGCRLSFVLRNSRYHARSVRGYRKCGLGFLSFGNSAEQHLHGACAFA